LCGEELLELDAELLLDDDDELLGPPGHLT